MAHVLPQLSECVTQLKANVKAWESYEETEEDKKVYVEGKQYQLQLKTEESLDEPNFSHLDYESKKEVTEKIHIDDQAINEGKSKF